MAMLDDSVLQFTSGNQESVDDALPLQVQAKFFTKQEKFSLPDTPFSIPASASSEQLNNLINSLHSNYNQEWENVDFDFLVIGELLRLPLKDHLQLKDFSSEHLIEIEYVQRYPSPELDTGLLHDDWVSTVNATDQWILTGCYDNTLHLWSLDGHRHKLTIPGHLGPIKSVAWVKTADDEANTFVSTSHDETAMLWQWNPFANSVDCVVVCKGHTRSVDCVDANLDRTKFASGSYDRTLKIWSAEVTWEDRSEETEAARKKFKGENGSAKSRSPLATMTGHGEAITGVQWTDNHEVMTCSMDHTLRLWDLELGGLKSQLNGSKAILGVSYSKLSCLAVTASADRHVRLWDPRSKEGSVVKCAFTSHTGWVSCVQWSPNEEHLFISGSYDNVLKLWDTRSTKASLYDMTGQEEKILCCDWSTNNFILSGGADNNLKIYSTKGVEHHDRVS